MASEMIDIFMEKTKQKITMRRISTLWKAYTSHNVIQESEKIIKLWALAPDRESITRHDYEAECIEPAPAKTDSYAKYAPVHIPRMISCFEMPSSKKKGTSSRRKNKSFSPSEHSDSDTTSIL